MIQRVAFLIIVNFLLGAPLSWGTTSADEVTTQAGEVTTHEIVSATQLQCLNGYDTPLGHHVDAIAFSADGKTVAGLLRGDALVWNVETGEVLQKIDSWSVSIALSPYGKTLALGAAVGGPTAVTLWDVETGKCLYPLDSEQEHQPEQLTDGMAFSPDGRILATKSHNAETLIEFWDVATGNSLHRTLMSYSVIHAHGEVPFAFSSDSGLFALGIRSAIRFRRVWESELVLMLGSVSTPIWTMPTPMAVNEGSLTAVAFSPDGRILAAVARRKEVYVWKLETRELLLKWEAEDETELIGFASDGTLVVANPYQVAKLDVNQGRLRKVVEIKGWSPRHPIALSSDCKLLATGESQGVVRVWSIE